MELTPTTDLIKYVLLHQKNNQRVELNPTNPPIKSMEVKISETSPVLPSRTPFPHDHVLPLSHLDIDPNMQVTFRYLRVYAPRPHLPSDPFSVISTALSSALVEYYPLAGTLRPRAAPADGRLELFCADGQGVPLVKATVESTLESLDHLDDPDATFVEKLVPDLDQRERLINPCALQLTVFSCGGFTLGACIHHSLCDGLGATLFFNVMAEIARGENRVAADPVWKRVELLGPRNPPRVEAPVNEFLSLEKGKLPYNWSVGPVARKCFHVRDECLEKFKHCLFEQSGSRFTTFEALGAFLWRAKVKASDVAESEKVKFAYSTNIRRQLNPPLPKNYWGNGCVPIYVQVRAKALKEQPIWETAKQIQKSKSYITDEYVRSFVDFQEIHHGDGITAGNEVSGFTDWRHLGHSSVDFGWGGPVTVFPLSRHLIGSVEPCFFLPVSSAKGGSKEGFKVSITLRETAMPAFRKEMENFCNQDFGI